MTKYICCLTAVALLLVAVPLLAQDEHGGGGGGCGDVLGDLIHVLRSPDTGQPILAKRFVELPAEIPGYGWGYCKIGLTADGGEIPFLPYSCDLDLDSDDDGVDDLVVVPVDYFGRLSGGRTKEKNHRMHFDEVISTIKMADMVKAEEATGRIKMGFECAGLGVPPCAEWAVVDSPMESLALYQRLMRYGHLQTDPREEDLWWHGDPKLVPPYQVALDPTDWAKFHRSLRHLLPTHDWRMCFDLGADGVYDAPEPYATVDGVFTWTDLDGDGVWDEGDAFDAACAQPQSLTTPDFARAGTYLGAAANKTGKITVDLVQYMNRILKLTKNTEASQATPDTLPALVRDCWDGPGDPLPPAEDDPNPVDPPYSADCTIYDASDDAAYEYFTAFYEATETFVDFGQAEYMRSEWRDESFEELILPPTSDDPEVFYLQQDVEAYSWLAYSNGGEPDDVYESIDGFVMGASDALRTIEYVHNYAVPDNLGYPY